MTVILRNKCPYSVCHIFALLYSVAMLNAVMLMLSVVVLSAEAWYKTPKKFY
jgi:hypothetical protein